MVFNNFIFAVVGLMLTVGLTGDAVKDGHDTRDSGAVRLEGRTLVFNDRCGIRFMRTLRIPDDGKTYPLPPGLGEFPIYRVADYADRVPAKWRREGGFFIPMYQAEAMWISFDAQAWKPNAIKIAVGDVNALDGRAWSLTLADSAQNYLVAPKQPWLDGIKSGEGVIRQFVAMPLGGGYTVEAQITGREDVGGLKIAVFEPKPGRFPDQPVSVYGWNRPMSAGEAKGLADGEMGLGAGGRMTQKVYADAYGVDTWDESRVKVAVIHIVNSAMFREITGKEPPPTPVDAAVYTSYGYPWFALYDERERDIAATDALKGVKSIGELAAERRDTTAAGRTPSFAVPDSQIVKLPRGK